MPAQPPFFIPIFNPTISAPFEAINVRTRRAAAGVNVMIGGLLRKVFDKEVADIFLPGDRKIKVQYSQSSFKDIIYTEMKKRGTHICESIFLERF
jgi:hypothetical protein